MLMNHLFENAWPVWLLIAVGAGILEVVLPYFTLCFVSFAALVSAASTYWLQAGGQIIVFSLALLGSLLFLRPKLVQKLHPPHKILNRSQALHHKKGEVTETIDLASGSGRVLVNGEDWSAQSHQIIEIGKEIEVHGSDGIVLLVKEIE